MSTTFADLHDTPERMMAKGVIHEIVDWRNAREYFYWKVRRKISESEVEQKLKLANKYVLLLGIYIYM